MSQLRCKHTRSRLRKVARWGGRILITVFVLAGIFPALLARAGSPVAPPISASAQDEQSWAWKLTGSAQSDEWQGDNFHGLKSEYTPIYNGDSIGATYTQYNIQFNASAPRTIASQLNGLCTWSWENGAIPGEVIPGTSYPFTLAVDASATGDNFLGGTVNGHTNNGESAGSFAFAQVYLDVNGQVRSGHQETSSSLTLSPGQNEGERRTVTTLCQVDIVTVKVEYDYQWSKTGCSATLKLPEEMKPGQEFSPQVTVVDSQQRTVRPESESWFYNGAPSGSRMKWDGKAATVEYEYVCPGETAARTTQVAIPPAPSCRAKIILPDKMEPDKTFIARAEVVDPDEKQVKPKSETWYYNAVPSSNPMKWDGNAATVEYEYVCPLDLQPGKASVQIPPAEKGSGWLVVVGGLAGVAAAGLALRKRGSSGG